MIINNNEGLAANHPPKLFKVFTLKKMLPTRAKTPASLGSFVRII
jgi:hypothetical protein